MAEKLGIYVHIPFCKHKCDYCDFYSLAGAEEAAHAAAGTTGRRAGATRRWVGIPPEEQAWRRSGHTNCCSGGCRPS